MLFTGPPEALANDFIDAVYTTPQGDLWLGSRTYGVFRYDGTDWQRFDYQDGLADNRVRGIFQDRDGAIWVGTAEGVSRYDGRTWFPNALPPGLPLTEFYDPILQSRDGTLYLNSVSDADAWRNRSGPQHATGPYILRTIRYVPETDPPETIMTIDPGEASQGGEITFAWTGADPWQSTLREDLQYAYRLDGGEWSPYGADMIRSFEDLDVGTHTLEVISARSGVQRRPHAGCEIVQRRSGGVAPSVVYWVDCRVCGHYGLPNYADYCQGSETAAIE